MRPFNEWFKCCFVAFAALFAAIRNRLGGKLAAEVIKAHHAVKIRQVLPLAARDNLVVAVEVFQIQ